MGVTPTLQKKSHLKRTRTQCTKKAIWAVPWSAYRRPRFCSSRGTYIDNPQINTWWVKRSSWKGPTQGALPWRLMSHFSLIIPNFNAVTLSKSCFTDWYFRLEGIRRRYRGAARIWKTIFRVDIATCYPSHPARMSSWLSSSTHLSPLSATLGRKKRQHVHPNLSRFRDRASPLFRHRLSCSILSRPRSVEARPESKTQYGNRKGRDGLRRWRMRTSSSRWWERLPAQKSS